MSDFIARINRNIFRVFFILCRYVLPLLQATKALRESRDIALLRF
jgi:hypothetical protein